MKAKLWNLDIGNPMASIDPVKIKAGLNKRPIHIEYPIEVFFMNNVNSTLDELDKRRRKVS